MNLKARTKTEQIKNILNSAIENGELRPDDALLSESKLAALHKVSVVTVRRAINELVRDGILYSVHGKGNFVRPKNAGGMRNIALVFGSRYVDSIAMQIHLHEWSNALSAELAKQSCSLLLRNSDGNINRIFEPPCDGYVLMDQNLPQAVINKIVRQAIPAVSIDNEFDAISALVPAHFQGGYDGMKFLLGKGYKNIEILTRSSSSYQGFDERLDGALAACRDSGIDPAYVPVRKTLNNYEIYLYVEQLKTGEIKPRPDAIFCFSDFMALELLQALRAGNLRVPEDIAVLGFDDILIAQHTRPALSTVAIDKSRAAQLIIKELLRMITRSGPNPGKIEIALSVADRESA